MKLLMMFLLPPLGATKYYDQNIEIVMKLLAVVLVVEELEETGAGC